ncbi:putative phage tail protein [Longicatena caecimuris]|uniref:putative phage tail protein n=1 Tax=Longicatena caecimuris TaxID=1796635 RepID=UPI0018A91197|nr:putative phage tail protein [Longicatena caecimuris]
MENKKVDLLSYLPPVVQDFEEIKQIMNTESAEFNLLVKEYHNLLCDQFVHEATENGLSRWERILKINPKPTDTLESRRWEILNRLNIKIPYTFKMLKNKLYALYGDDYTIKLISDIYTIRIRLPPVSDSELRSTFNMVSVISPANMIIDIAIDENLETKERKFIL